MSWIVLLVLLALTIVQGINFDDPCNIIAGSDFSENQDTTVHLNVPVMCNSGTFWWNYPIGHVVLHFPNANHLTTHICLKDGVGGRIFTMTDVSPGVNKTLGQVDWQTNKTVCTDPTTSSEILLKITAPELIRYMGSMLYTVVR